MARQRTSAKGLKTVVWFQGGGPLGAFGCGVWGELVRGLREEGSEVVALGGASMGAVNAAIVRAHLHEEDGGAALLESVWRDEIATPSWPFLGLAWGGNASARHWNGLLTGILAGNGLYRPQPWTWTLWGMANRIERPLFDRGPMWRLLKAHVPAYQSHAPSDVLLAVASTSVGGGVLRLHHSDAGELGLEHVAASSAFPGMFDAVDIDGELQWDGELVPSSPLPGLLNAVRESGRAGEGEPLRLVTIEQMPRPAAGPVRSTPEVIFRAVNLSQVDKLKLPPEHLVEHVRIMRPEMPFDGISGLFDHSCERIASLIDSGRSVAAAHFAYTEVSVPARPRATELTP